MNSSVKSRYSENKGDASYNISASERGTGSVLVLVLPSQVLHKAILLFFIALTLTSKPHAESYDHL